MNSFFSKFVKFHFKRAIAELYDSSIKGAIARNKK